jgi:hypothetical protein
MSDTTSDSENADTSDSVGRFTENIEEVFYALPILRSTTFACHICSKTAQNLKTHNSLKKHFKNHHSSVIVRFECRLCKCELPGVKKYAAHADDFHSALPAPPPDVTDVQHDSPSTTPNRLTLIVQDLTHDASPHSAISSAILTASSLKHGCGLLQSAFYLLLRFLPLL